MELRMLLADAHDVNEAILNKYAAMGAEGGDEVEDMFEEEEDVKERNDWFKENDPKMWTPDSSPGPSTGDGYL
jgi:hypothetical protein